jgi:crotonobetainyl-CoA:carnitine CoA-transferase CaiB-like acyl-CoA transferase
MLDLLAGIRVVEAAPFLPGPLCSWYLAALGADVVKIEPPDGDPYRHFEPKLADGTSAAFHLANGGKRSVRLDLKDSAARQEAVELCRGADVFIDGYRPGVAARLGLGIEDVQAVAPQIVYCSISGFGQNGPRRGQPGHDLNYASLAGVVATTGVEGGPPVRPSVPLGDTTSALVAALTIVAALSERPRRAHVIDVAIADCLLSALAPRLDRLLAGCEPTPRGQLSSPANDVYRCADGRYVSIGAIEAHFWRRLCDVLGLDRLGRDATLEADGARFGRREELREALTQAFAQLPSTEWLERLEAADVPCAPVLEPGEALEDPQFQARYIRQPLVGSAAPWALRFPALVDGRTSSPAPAPPYVVASAATT